MSLSSLSIRRPVLATVFSILIILFGVIGFDRLGVREYPSVDPPVITVSTSYPGANADVVESQITEPIEESVNGIAGVRTLTSVSRESRSTITIEFDLSVDLETAANDVRDRVSRSQRNLPPDVDNPIVSKADANSSPIIFLNVASDTRDPLELTEIGISLFKERLQTIPGVSGISIWGEKTYSMRLLLDPLRLSARGLALTDVANALQRENVELPTGRIEGNATELSVRTIGRLVTPEDFNDLIISEQNGAITRLRDVGTARIAPENERTVLKRDGRPMIGVVLIPQAGANNIAIADEFYRRLEGIKKDLPEDIKLGIGFDTTDYIRDSIDEVVQTIFLAFGLVVLVIFFFLRDWRTTLIPTLVIPVALIGTFFVMLLADFSINVLTLLGLVLAIGLVVDDAIVVLENIYTKIEEGMTPLQAGLEGSREVFFAVIATTIALAAVFLPVMFLEGLTGRLFREFGVVLAGAVIISSFVALTLTPMLSTKLLKERQKQNRFYEATEPFFRRLTAGYRSLLESFMRHRWLVLPIVGLCSFLIWLFMVSLPSELAPLEDRSGLRMFASGPEGATFEYMDDYMDRVITVMNDSVPGIEAIISVTSPGFGASSSVNSGFMRILLKQPDEREQTQSEIAGMMNRLIRGMPGARGFFSEEQTIGGRRRGLPVEVVIQAQNLEKLRDAIPRLEEAAGQSSLFSVVEVDLKFNKPELEVNINRSKAQALGLSTFDVARALQISLSDGRLGYFIRNGKQYQVIGQLERTQRDEPIDLKSIFLRNNRGEMIQLGNLIEMHEESRPPQLFRYNRYVSATISAGLADGVTIDRGIAEMQSIADSLLDDTYTTALTGTSRDFVESSSSLIFAFLLALLLIYLTLAAQFESFRDPLIILFTVPLALTGALLSLWYFDQTLNIFSQIGMIMLIGLVTKNGILIVEFANQRREAGRDRDSAILEAATARFRPILMTSLSTILGALPIALALGAGAQSRVSMGIVVVGGLVVATLLTLFVIPGVYSWLSGAHKVSPPKITTLLLLVLPLALTTDLAAQETSLTLRETIAIALERGSASAIAEREIDRAESTLFFGATGLLPRLDAVARTNGSITNSAQEYASGETIERTGAVGTGYSAGLAVEWELFNGFGGYRELDRRRGLRALAEVERDAVDQGIATEVALLYLDLVRNIRLLVVDREAIALSLNRLGRARARVETGAGIRFDMTQAQVDLDADSSALLLREIEIVSARQRLNRLLERPLGTPFTPVDTIPLRLTLPEREELLRLTITNDPAIRALDGAVTVARAVRGVIASESLPTLTLDLGYDLTGSESGAGFILSNRSSGFNYGLTARWNIFNGFQTSRRIEEQDIATEILGLRRARRITDLTAEFEDLYTRYEARARLARYERDRIEAARQNLLLANDRLALGSITPLEVRQAETRLVEAVSRLVDAEYARDRLALQLAGLSGVLVE